MLTCQQIAEWEAYDAIEPIDSNYRLEFMLAQVTSTLVKLFASPPEGAEQKEITAMNFMPDWLAYAKKRVYPVRKKKELLPEEIEKQNKEIAQKVLNLFTAMGKEEK